MIKDHQDKLTQARDLIFTVEQECIKEGTDNKLQGANALYTARLEINNAMSRI